MRLTDLISREIEGLLSKLSSPEEEVFYEVIAAEEQWTLVVTVFLFHQSDDGELTTASKKWVGPPSSIELAEWLHETLSIVRSASSKTFDSKLEHKLSEAIEDNS
ncbi:hypothetical protein [Streptomyces sp. CoH17]|uniref:hypothetical protein n=1 Tax=Streptomyces sp. CoH17 TaxID=2992806 RepID=UPI00226E425C|nr:hypothetical protein [Streptomyces sp. CoH17]